MTLASTSQVRELISTRSASWGSPNVYEAAKQVRDEAQTVMDEERQNRIAELRKRIDERKDAEKELAALKPVGAPRKPRVKRGTLSATPKATKEAPATA